MELVIPGGLILLTIFSVSYIVCYGLGFFDGF